MSANIIIPPESTLYQSFEQMCRQRRFVFFAGLPGVGKSLLLQQLALMAHERGRVVHLLQWDVTRAAFESDEVLARYPEIDGVTHAAIRKAVGLWTREGVLQWHEQYADAQHMLIGEVPLIGNRLIELVQKRDDAVESLLTSKQTLFVIPIPSRAVRQRIEAARERTIAQPRHERESADAPPNVLQALWQDLYRLAHELGFVDQVTEDKIPYDPDVYAGVYQYLLQHRHVETLLIDTILRSSGSAYDLDMISSELSAPPDEVPRIMAQIEEKYASREEELEREVAQWYRV